MIRVLLAKPLGCLARERVEIEQVNIEDFAPNDFEMQRPMCDGRIDASESGRWRATSIAPRIDARSAFNNRLVIRAMARIP